MAERVQAHVVVSGVVQGVFFRASTARMATDLGVDGWVRNLDDGRVEALFEGAPGMVAEAVAWVRHGPPSAVVEDVDIDFSEPGTARGFRIL